MQSFTTDTQPIPLYQTLSLPYVSINLAKPLAPLTESLEALGHMSDAALESYRSAEGTVNELVGSAKHAASEVSAWFNGIDQHRFVSIGAAGGQAAVQAINDAVQAQVSALENIAAVDLGSKLQRCNDAQQELARSLDAFVPVSLTQEVRSLSLFLSLTTSLRCATLCWIARRRPSTLSSRSRSAPSAASRARSCQSAALAASLASSRDSATVPLLISASSGESLCARAPV